jgi:hypothetical protein
MVLKITSRPAADATLSKVAVVTGGASGIGVDLFVSNAGIAIDGGIDTPTPPRPPSRRRGGRRSLRLRTRSA